MSNIINKVKDALHSDKSTTSNTHSNTHSASEGTAGPHSSRVANAADPRIDSDLDGSRNAGMRKTAGHGEYGSSGVGSNTMGSNTMGSNTYGSGNTGRTTGNTMGMGSSGMESSGMGSSGMRSSGMGSSGMGSSGMGSSGMGSSGVSEGSVGPHSSRIANAIDPRVDSDLDNSRTIGGNTGSNTYGSSNTGGLGSSGQTFGSSNNNQYGTSGQSGSTGSHGLQSSGNTYGTSGQSGLTGSHGLQSSMHNSGTSGPGPAHNTAGPHSSDIANKLDPRVDSDMDGSKTMGQNKTYQSGNQSSGLTGRRVDPTDAAQVPPSILQAHIGPPTIEHDHNDHHRERRNSIKTHQESHSGI